MRHWDISGMEARLHPFLASAMNGLHCPRVYLQRKDPRLRAAWAVERVWTFGQKSHTEKRAAYTWLSGPQQSLQLTLWRLNDHYSGRTAPLTSKRCIAYIYSTNRGTEYFKHGIYSPFFSLQNAVRFIILTYFVPVLFTFYIFIQQI